jgi:bacteriocin biosynthesis cyclodehydratase domain-containing protein
MTERAILIVRSDNATVVKSPIERSADAYAHRRAGSPDHPAWPTPRSAGVRHQPLLLVLVLELRPEGLAAETAQGSLPQRPLLAPWLRRATLDGSLLLEYADEIAVLEGEAVDRLIRRLDGSLTLEELDPAEREAVARLAAAGVVVPGPAVGSGESLREAALGRVAPSVAAARLEAARVAIVGSGEIADEAERLLPGCVVRAGWQAPLVDLDLAVAAPSAAELPELGAWNERCLESATAWLLVLPFNGRFGSIGPLFIPGETCCYACFTLRRAAALPDPADFLALESAPASYPVGRSLAAVLAGGAAVVAAGWLARQDGALAGAFASIELEDGLRTTRHRVLRVPRCGACSPSGSMPPLLPWASGLTR